MVDEVVDKKDTKVSVVTTPVVETIASKEGPYVYIGPNLFTQGLFTNQIYVIIPEFKELEVSHPLFKQLFVHVSDLNMALDAVKQAGTVLNVAYTQLKGE